MSRGQRVLQIGRSVIRDGLDHHLEIARGLTEAGARVVSILQRGLMDPDRAADFPGRQHCLDAGRRRRFKNPYALATACVFAGGVPAELALCHHLTPARAVRHLMRLGLVRRGVLVVRDYGYFDPADPQGRRRGEFLRAAVHGRWQLVAASGVLLAQVREQVPGLPEARCRVIHDPIDADALAAELLSRAEARAVLGLGPGDFVLGTVGRLVPDKGHDDLIAAFGAVHRQMPQARLVIIGGGPLERELRAQAAAAGVAETVRLPGFLPGASRHLPAFDAFVLPSRQEPVGLVLLEAMACALPVMASGTRAAAEILPPGLPGFPPGAREALAAGLLGLYRMTPEARAALGDRGRAHVRRAFSVERFRADYAALLQPPARAA